MLTPAGCQRRPSNLKALSKMCLILIFNSLGTALETLANLRWFQRKGVPIGCSTNADARPFRWWKPDSMAANPTEKVAIPTLATTAVVLRLCRYIYHESRRWVAMLNVANSLTSCIQRPAAAAAANLCSRLCSQPFLECVSKSFTGPQDCKEGSFFCLFQKNCLPQL